MRDLVTLFVEASLAKGEWLAALHTVHLAATSPTSTATSSCTSSSQGGDPSHYHTIARMLSSRSNWAAALATLRLAPPPQRGYSREHLAERVKLYHDVLCGSHSTRSVVNSLSGEAQTVRKAVSLATEAFRGSSTTSSKTPDSSASPVPPTADPLAAASAALVTWCGQQLSALPATSPLRAEEKVALMTKLRASASVAQQTVLRSSTKRQSLPSSDSPSPAPTTPHTDERRGADARSTPASSPAAPKPIANLWKLEEELDVLVRRRVPARDDWARALELLSRLPSDRMTPRIFMAVTRLLANRGRRTDFEALVRTYLYPADPATRTEHVPVLVDARDEQTKPEQRLAGTAVAQATATVLVADPNLLKAVAEACRRLQSHRVAAAVLSRSLLRHHLTPSAAVPLVMVLRDACAYAPVMAWWADLREGEETPRYPLLQHAKLSSYVASCVLRNARDMEVKKAIRAGGVGGKGVATTSAVGWVAALRVFEDAEKGDGVDPALVLLFELQLLRQVKQWEAAQQLFARFAAQHPRPMLPLPPSHRQQQQEQKSRMFHHGEAHRGHKTTSPTPLESVFAVLTEERVEQWVPPQPLAQLRRDVAHYKAAISPGRSKTEQGTTGETQHGSES